MPWSSYPKQVLSALVVAVLLGTGTYNAVVINSESALNGAEVKFVKRLDELHGIVVSKREVAASMTWQKLTLKQAALIKSNPGPQIENQKSISSERSSAPIEELSQAAVQDELNLSLAEVINPRKWQQGLSSDQFNGHLSTRNGVIEALSVSLPNGESVAVSFSEMTGNVFEYDFGGELYSGMMYQVEQNAYMVTLTNGPLEGTRLKFTSEATNEQVVQQENDQRDHAHNQDSEVGGHQENEAQLTEYAPQENLEMMAQQNRPMDEGNLTGQLEQNAGYSFEIQQAM
jgi:hypothetical protein